jgi:hypothetical protein
MRSPLLRRCLITVCSLALFPAIAVGGAQTEPAGTVLAIKGVVTVSGRDGQAPRPLQRGENIFSGDNLQAQDGQAQVRFSDGGLLSIYPDSAANIAEYLFLSQDPAHSKCLLTLAKGTFAARTGEIGKQAGEQFQMKTDFATLFVRGTEFTVKVDKTMSVAVNEGAVVMNNGAGSHEVRQGNTATFTSFSRSPEMTNQTVGLRSGGQQQARTDGAPGEGGQKKGEGKEGEGGRQTTQQGGGRDGGTQSGMGGQQQGGAQMGGSPVGGAGAAGAGPAVVGMPTGLPLGGGFAMGRSGGGTTGPIGGNPPPPPGAPQLQNQVGHKILPALQPQQPPQQPPPQPPPPGPH